MTSSDLHPAGPAPRPAFSSTRLRRAARSALAFMLAAGALLPAGASGAAKSSVEGRVQHVVDGDSLWLAPADGGAPIEIRLLGIDAPEICQAWGHEAKQALSELVDKQTVQAELGAVDTYGRRLATLYVGTRNINRALVQEGHAWSARYKWDRGPYVADERMARALGRGLNHEPGALMPKDFRREHGPCFAGEPAAVAATTTAPAAATAARPAAAAATAAKPATTSAATASAYRCDGRTRCAQMHSCDEATWFLKHCPGVQMDGNHDGVPCERQWCRP